MLQELKVAHDWALKNREIAGRAKAINPEAYEYADKLYNTAKKSFDDACEAFIVKLQKIEDRKPGQYSFGGIKGTI